MTIRHPVEDFVALGPLPASNASEETIANHRMRLARLERPVTDEEAAVLMRCFGPDDCYGLAWTLLHLVESAPGGAPIEQPPSQTENEWIKRLWARAHHD